MRPAILLLAIGNPDRGDDGVALAIARALDGRLPDGAAVTLCSGDLLAAMEAWQHYDALICVDAAAPGGQPGSISRFDLAEGPLPVDFETISSHAFGLGQTIALARQLRLAPETIVVFAIEGESFTAGAPLSDAVAASIAPACEAILTETRHIAEGKVHA